MYYNEYEYPMYYPNQEDERFIPFALGFGLGNVDFGRPFYGRRPYYSPYGRRSWWQQQYWDRPWWQQYPWGPQWGRPGWGRRRYWD